MPRTRTSDVTAQRVGAEVRTTRLAQGLTQAGLGRRLDVSASYIATVEAGRANLTIGALAALATALGTGLSVQFPLPAGDEWAHPELAAPVAV